MDLGAKPGLSLHRQSDDRPLTGYHLLASDRPTGARGMAPGA